MTSRARSPMVFHSPLIFHSGNAIDAPSTVIRERLEFFSDDWKKLCEEEVRAETCMSAMDEKLDTMMTMLANLEHNANGRNRDQHNRLESSQTQFQVQDFDLEQNQRDSQLGYRYDALTMANCEKMSQETVMPVFDGSQPSVWIVNVERFFQLGRYRDDAKLDLVFLCLEGDASRWFSREMRHKRFMDWVDFKRRLLAKYDSVQKCSPHEAMLKQVSFLEINHGEEKADSFTEHETLQSINMEHESVDKIYSLSPVQKPVEIQKHTSSQSTNLKDEAVSNKNIVLETVVVHEATSPSREESEEISGDVLSSLMQTATFQNKDYIVGIMHKNGSLLEVEQEAEISLKSKDNESLLIRTGDELVEISKNWIDLPQPVIGDAMCEHSIDRIEEKLKLSQHGTAKFVMFNMKMLLVSRRFNQPTFGEMNLHNKHKWKSKQLQAGSHSESLMQLILADINFHLKHKWRFKQLNQASVLVIVLAQVAQRKCSKTSFVDRTVISQRDQKHLNGSMDHKRVVWLWFCPSEALNQSQVLSPYAFVVSPYVLPIRVAGNRTELPPSGSFHGSSPIILISPSLRSSLFSEEGVYKSIHTCLLLMYVLIWRYGRERKEKSELISEGLLQNFFQQFIHDHAKWDCSETEKRKLQLHTRVSNVMNHLWLIERRVMLLMYHMGHLLQLLIQHKQRWKRNYKNRMFKYKAGIKQSAAEEKLDWIRFMLPNLFLFIKLEGKLVIKGGVLIRVFNTDQRRRDKQSLQMVSKVCC